MEIFKKDKDRIIELDILRGIACIFVVFFHYTTKYDQLYGHSQDMFLNIFYGSKGFNLFFIISGFVIFMTLEKTMRPMDFVISRISRLYPAYWVAIILTFTLTHVVGLRGRLVSCGAAIINFSMLQSFFKVPNVDEVYWTLQIELLFYFLMFSLFSLNLFKKINKIISVLLTIGILYKIFILLTGNTVKTFEYIRAFLVLDYLSWFALGIVFFKLYKHSEVKDFFIYVVLFLSCMAIFLDSKDFMEVTINYLVIFVFLFILFFCPRFLKSNFLIFLGTISYSLYLIHQNIGYIFIQELYKFNIGPYFILFIVISSILLVATGLTFLVEKPAISFFRKKYKDQFKNNRKNIVQKFSVF